MAHKSYKDMTFSIDNAAGAITALTGSINNASLQAALNLMEDIGLGDSDGTSLPGIHRKTVPINGWVNTTTEGIFGPLLTARTSVTKTVQLYNGVKYYNGEAWPESVQISGAADDLQTWSVNLVGDGAWNRTSVALS